MAVPRLAKHVAQWANAAAKSVAGSVLEDNAISQAKVADDAVGAAELKVVVRDITVAAEAATGTATVAGDAGGVVLGFSVSNVEHNVKTIALNGSTGKLDVTLSAAQAAGQAAHVYVVILQA